MKIFNHIFIIFLALSLAIVGCQKENIVPENYFETKINDAEKVFVPQNANIAKGITIIAAIDKKDNSQKTIVISINGDQVGSYKQTFDYKTGVSISQCGLSYKTISKDKNTDTNFYSSYQGKVEISDIDLKNKKISGTYNFKLYSVPDNNKPYTISGKFIKLSFN